MKQVLGIRDEKTRMKVTLPLAVAPITQDDDMRWNPNVNVRVIPCFCFPDSSRRREQRKFYSLIHSTSLTTLLGLSQHAFERI